MGKASTVMAEPADEARAASDEKRRTFSVYFPEWLIADTDEVAAEDGLPRARVVELATREYLERRRRLRQQQS